MAKKRGRESFLDVYLMAAVMIGICMPQKKTPDPFLFLCTAGGGGAAEMMLGVLEVCAAAAY